MPKPFMIVTLGAGDAGGDGEVPPACRNSRIRRTAETAGNVGVDLADAAADIAVDLVEIQIAFEDTGVRPCM